MCCPEKPRSPVPLLLLVAAIAAIVFWPMVAMVAHTVAVIVKAVLIAGLVAVLAGAAVAVGVKLRRHQQQTATASVVAVRPTQHVDEQIAALIAAANRLADQHRPVLSAPVPNPLSDRQVQALLLQLSLLAASGGLHPHEFAERWDGR